MRTMDTSDGLVQFSVRYLIETLRGIVVVGFVFGAFSLPVLYPFAAENPQLAVYGLLGVLGWGIHFGQDVALERMGRTETTSPDGDDFGPAVLFLYLAATMLYYNVVVLVTAAVATSFSLAGFPVLAVVAATLYPVYDAVTARHNWPVSFGGIVAATVWILGHSVRAARGVNWSSLGFDRFSIDVWTRFDRRIRTT